MSKAGNEQDPSLRLEHIPQAVRDELQIFVEGILDYQPLVVVEEIILFGSLAEGNWNPQESDIDLAVIVGEDLNYSHVHQLEGHTSPQQMQLVVCGIQHLKSLASRMHVFVCTISDFDLVLPRINDGRGLLSDSIRKGIPLYSK